MSVQFDLSPRERMFMAKMALFESEKEDNLRHKLARKESRKLSMAASLNSDNTKEEPMFPSSSSHSESIVKPSSILRKPSLLPPSSYQASGSPKAFQLPAIPSSPAPSLPLPPAPKVEQDSDFGPSISLPSPTASSSTNALRRRSSRVRFSDQQLQPIPNPHQITRSTSLKSLRRESSIDGLRADLIQASFSLNSRKSSAQSQSLGRRLSAASIGSSFKRDSFASSVGSDPFGWATSSHGSDLDLNLRKESLAAIQFTDLDDEVLLKMIEEKDKGFKPQILPYPKISRASFSSNPRSSVESTTSSVWLTQPQDDCSDRSDLHSVYSAIDSPSSDFVGDGYMSRQSSQFSLEAKLRTSLSDSATSAATSRKSSYQPSLAQTPDSLRSSNSDNEFRVQCDSKNSATLMNIQLPTRAYSSLLPSRRRRSSLLSISIVPDEHLPHLNRGEWDDPELGLSPRSGPVRSLGSLTNSSRRGTKLSEEIIVQTSPQVDQNSDNEELEVDVVIPVKVELRSSQDSIDLLPALPSPVRTSFNRIDEVELGSVSKGHTRSESSLSAISSFPIPPDRVMESMSSQLLDQESLEDQASKDTNDNISSPLLDEYDDTPTIEKIMEINFKPEVEDTSSLRTPRMLNEAVQPKEISLNSPFIEHDSSQPMQIESPLPEMIEISSDPVEIEIHRPPSPEIQDILRTVRRPSRTRRVSVGDEHSSETEESDLDVVSPLIKVALDSNIVSPRSRLLSPPSRPTSLRSISTNSINTLSSLRSGLGLTSGRGWSGSESEEEEWISTVRQIKERRSVSKSPKTPQPIKSKKSNTLTVQIDLELEETPTPKKTKRFSSSSFTSSSSSSSIIKNNEKENSNRYSQLSEISIITSEENSIPLTPHTLEILTPSIIGLSRSNSNISSNSSNNTQPGNFPWGLSSQPNSPIKGLFSNNLINTKKELITSFRTNSNNNNNKNKNLPKPKIEINEECWGEPEILIDQYNSNLNLLDYDELNENENLKSSISLKHSNSNTSLKSDISIYVENELQFRRSTLKSLQHLRSVSPDLWIKDESENNLMNEEMPEM
ncbi:uncharacterized protein I206_106482 [Kwoniella pini CBS 10737]|uniref:Uncharacterized protein n=1 Tax=Kwoniella pini CBS 10737 TaxID=1296096 RepID=A0A1B9HUG1_9TREE|nr:uncharacterized protein I206_07287 [Kwoniella pini CBS 10737]OCF46900.1 hypothetical protein I206_07287 [Kwoniella pini CBS 10737]